jgi:acetyltransferase-like isoleucine patch superfamily enzyme
MSTLRRWVIDLAARTGRLAQLMTTYAFRKAIGDELRVEAWRRLGLRANEVDIGPRVSIRSPAHVTIGDGSHISGTVLIDAWTDIRIGRNCIFNDDIKLIGGSHHLDSPDFAGYEEPIEIGDYVWLPHRILVMPGVTIGHHAVVGSGSVVTRDVEPYAVVAGTPAKVIGERARHEYTYIGTRLWQD